MRTLPHQPTLRPVFVSHEHASELAEIDRILSECPEAAAAVERDLVAGVTNPGTGRRGMTAEQVIRAIIVKQLGSFSYEQLAFHLTDSQTYRTFCRFGALDGTLRAQLEHYLELTRRVAEQTERRGFLGESVPAAEKIVSIFEPHVDIIRKGSRDTVFGHKVYLTVGESLILDVVVSSGNPADATMVGKLVVGEPPLDQIATL